MNDRQTKTLLAFFKAVAQPERLQIMGLVANKSWQ
jgi:hypothetical protein